MNNFRNLRSRTLLRRELLENKTLIFIGPLFLVALSLVVIVFSAFFVDRIGTILGEHVVGQLLVDLRTEAIEENSRIDIYFSSQGSDLDHDLNLFDPDERLNIGSNSNSGNFGELSDQNILQGYTFNQILYPLHKLLMLFPFFVALSYLSGALLFDRLDGSYYFWRSMPVSAREEIITKIMVALFVIPAIYLCASLVIQILSLLVFVFPIYRIGLNPISIIFHNFEIIDWLSYLVLDWINRGFLFAPLFSWVLLASALARRSAVPVAILPILLMVVLEHFFLGTGKIYGSAMHYLPYPFASDDYSPSNPVMLVIGLVFSFSFLAGAVFFRRHPISI